MYEPTLEQFKSRATQGNVVPVYRIIMADLETPVSAFIKLAKDDPHAFLLESVEQGEKLGRYSFIGVTPSRMFICKDKQLIERTPDQETIHDLSQGQDPLAILESFIKQFHLVECEELPPFTGGLVGYLGYEMTQYFEELTFTNRDDYKIPDSVFYYTDTMVIFDHFQRTMTVLANAYIQNDPDTAFHDAIRRIKMVVEKLKAPLPQVPFGTGLPTPPTVKTNWEKAEFQDAVAKSLEHIKAGDIYQIQVGIRSEVELSSSSLDLYRALRRINPSPYTFYFRYEEVCLVGGSPEILVRMVNDHVTYRPIAGTRRRGKTVEEDQYMQKELANDPKEQAEHIMLVDLGRNDIGRVCEYHTVKVTDLMYIERYSHVMHLVSNVEGDLLGDKNGFDLLRVTFPAGTVTGAPKIRSMEIIEELEKTKRGPYAGALGWFGLNGDLDFCITLRTIVILDNKAYIQASAGIVADSDPDLEYKEVMNKSRAMLRAIELAECSKE
ncbi:MAG: anthranilate synthase component I [bacterium]|nr:anthranilate synthase component I [bacterium]